MIDRVELLAPAGTYECFIAAINAGADAVYMGLDKFSARANAGNFTVEELVHALDIAHILGKKIYLTLNTLMKDYEIEELYELLLEPYLHGLDGVIVQDIGVIDYIRNCFPDMEIHASTQMAITDANGVEFVKNMGITRVVPARELSLKEIKSIKDKTGIEVECFIHGALCYSYSGKCLFSSFLGGRSGNRGRCAQPCRLPYNDNEYILSMKDLCTLDILPELIKAGIDSFKIEGRMKSPDYVYGVTSIYRKYIDMYYDNKPYKLDLADKDRILSLYTRSGNCNGYYYKKNGRDMITIKSPSYSSDGESKKLIFDEKSLRTLQIDMLVIVKQDNPVSVSLKVADDCTNNKDLSIDFKSDIVPQLAINSSLLKENVIKQFSKTGGTVFTVRKCDVNIDDGLFLANGQLNSIRRAALEHLRCEIVKNSYRDNSQVNKFGNCKVDCHQENDSGCRINVSVNSYEQFIQVINAKAVDGIILPAFMLEEIIAKDEVIFKTRPDIFIKLPYIIRDNGMGNSAARIITIIKSASEYFANKHNISIKGYYVSNYESINLLKNNDYDGLIVGDIHMYTFNRNAYRALSNLGVTKFTVPIELSKKELISRNVVGEELIIYGRIPMMISAGCVKNTVNGCKKDPKGHSLAITDRKNAKMPVQCLCNECTNIIYNSVPLSIATEIDLIDRIRPSSLRIMLSNEKADEINMILQKCEIIQSGSKLSEEFVHSYTKGHVRKAVD